jgi:homogentisate 1,2-dioxygenase
MDQPWIRGKVARQAHVGLPPGTVEEEYGRSGFFGGYAHAYRLHAPVGWVEIDGPLKPRAYDLRRTLAPGQDDTQRAMGRTLFAENDDVRIHHVRVEETPSFWLRNGDADELIFIHKGRGILSTELGPLSYEPGVYLVVPRAMLTRLEPSEPTEAILVESAGAVTFPDRGMLGLHALFDPAVIDVPTPDLDAVCAAADVAQDQPEKRYEVRHLRGGEVTRVVYPFHPIDVVGWKGTTAPMRLHTKDIRPVLSERYHLPPSAHTTFLLRDAVVCSFLPRGLETGDPEALRVPFFHSNADYDELIFYHEGTFFSRGGIEPGMITMHPAGIHHGPHPKAAERAKAQGRTDEVAIMIDTKKPLRMVHAAESAEIADYWKSWAT